MSEVTGLNENSTYSIYVYVRAFKETNLSYCELNLFYSFCDCTNCSRIFFNSNIRFLANGQNNTLLYFGIYIECNDIVFWFERSPNICCGVFGSRRIARRQIAQFFSAE